MFDHTHYVPILRWKQAEWMALRKLDPADALRITPLIELVPKAFKPTERITTVDARLAKTAGDIFENWGQNPLFVDLWLLPSNLCSESGEHTLSALNKEAQSYQLPLIPVTGLGRDRAYQAAALSVVQRNQQGVCVRLFLGDLRNPKLASELEDLLGYLGLKAEEVDLLVDCQITNSADPTCADICGSTPDLHRWRTFSIASGAFPEDLSGFEKNQQYELARSDWLTWRSQVVASPTLPRLPTYSDYTIQHPEYRERSGFLNFSGSIRYTYEGYWVIMRGEGVFNEDGPGFAQWPANAQLLCERDEFCGSDFCYGDRYIEDMGMQIDKSGSATTWLRAGINHHIVFVVRQIAKMFDVSTGSTL
jgi:hypothetical protein